VWGLAAEEVRSLQEAYEAVEESSRKKTVVLSVRAALDRTL
jgi:hypothetical protein